jgi:anion-transporting  ArsA/GET3 family ATPase
MDNKVISRLLRPVVMAGRMGLGGLATISEKVLGGVTSVTGFSALRNFAEFILLMQEVIEGFHRAGERVLGILKRSSTSFVLIAAPHKAAARAAKALATELDTMGYRLDGLVFNRCLPAGVLTDLGGLDATDHAILSTRARSEDKIIDDLAGFVAVRAGGVDAWTLRVDEQAGDLQTMDGIVKFSTLYR